MTRKPVIGILAVTLLGGAGAWYAFSDSSGVPALTDLDLTSFSQVQREFNAAAGKVHVIALLSPT